MKISWISIGLGAFALGMLLPGLGGKPWLTHYMEHAYSVPIPLEMREHGEYLTPLLEGEPHLLKPPLLWWMILLSYKLWGLSLGALRFPSALCGAASALATLRLGKTLGLNEKKSAAASLLAMGSIGLYGIYRLALIDAPLTFLMVVAFDGLAQFLLHRQISGLYECAVSSGLSMMCKWPVAPVVVGLTVAGWMIWERDGSLLKKMKWHGIGALAVALAIAVPWNAVMAYRYGSHYWRTVFLGELFTVRFITSQNIPLGAFLMECLAALAPWTLIVLVIAAKEKYREREDRLILVWMAASLLPFLVQRTKTERYALFIIPPLLILVLRHFDWADAWHRAAARATSLLILFLTLAIAGLSYWFHAEPLTSLLVLACGAAAAAALGLGGNLTLAGLGACGLFLTTGGLLLPGLDASPYPARSLFEPSSAPTSLFSGSHDLAYLPIELGKSLWSLTDFSGLRLALSQNHTLVTDQETLPVLRAFVKASGGDGTAIAGTWQSLGGIRHDRSALESALRTRSLEPLIQSRYILARIHSPNGFAPQGRFIPGPEARTSVKPGTYLVYLAVDCPEGLNDFAGFKQIGWVHVNVNNWHIDLSTALHKRDLLRSRPYIFVWPLTLNTPGELESAVTDTQPDSPPIRIEGLWIQNAPGDAIENLYNQAKH